MNPALRPPRRASRLLRGATHARKPALLCGLLVLALVGAREQTASAASFSVDSTADAVDANPGDGVCADATGACTLRAAIQETNALPGADTVTMPGGTYALTIAGADEDASATGDLDITDDLTIKGVAMADTVVDGARLDRVFHTPLPPGATASVEISSLTVRNGSAMPTDPTSSEGTGGAGGGIFNESGVMSLGGVTIRQNFAASAGGGIANGNAHFAAFNSTIVNNEGGFGGGLSNLGTAIVDHTLVSGNSSPTNGGGIGSSGALTLTDSEVSWNTARAFTGGGIYSSGTLTVERSGINANTAGISPVLPLRGEGGGIYAIVSANITDSNITGNSANNSGGGISGDVGALTLSNVTVSGNSAGVSGGGIAHGTRPTSPQSASMILTNVTVSGNSAGASGGGIANGGDGNTATASLINVTASGNSAASGPGIANTGGDTVTLANSLLANDQPGANCAGLITSAGHNLENGNSCGFVATGDITNNDPLLGALQGNGGPTQTQALLPGSPAIDAGDDNVCLDTDQRGAVRPIDGNGDSSAMCDVGAYEAPAGTGQPPPVTATPAGLPQTGAGGRADDTPQVTTGIATGLGMTVAILALVLSKTCVRGQEHSAGSVKIKLRGRAGRGK